MVEDNVNLVDRVKRHLGRLYPIDVSNTGKDALNKVSRIGYGVIILDLGLPDIPGLSVCKQIRSQGVTTPILVLTGIDDPTTRVNLLDSGADDYVTKPFNREELRARIAALTRRHAQRPKGPSLKVGDLTIDTEQRKVYRSGRHIPLRRKEFDILEYLVNNKGRVLTREMIIDHAWDSNRTSWNSTVDVHIKHLRDKIDRPFDYSLIKTAYGLGYTVDVPD